MYSFSQVRLFPELNTCVHVWVIMHPQLQRSSDSAFTVGTLRMYVTVT